jgi:cystathionine beta-lyase/cystathionine gamma-synthase
MTNPLLDVIDHRAVAAFAKENGIHAVIDSTFASPINFRPIEHGFSLVFHSATKYLNGHDDVIAGAIIGRRDLVSAILRRLNHLGGSLDAHACFLLHRGLKTLHVRVGKQNENALAIARFLADHPAVSRVNYPGLESHRGHKLAKELFDGFGGMLSFELHAGVKAAERAISRMKIALHAPSLGGVETLISRPAALSPRGLTAEQRRSLGIDEGLVRVSVGIENARDLIDDFAQALGGA